MWESTEIVVYMIYALTWCDTFFVASGVRRATVAKVDAGNVHLQPKLGHVG